MWEQSKADLQDFQECAAGEAYDSENLTQPEPDVLPASVRSREPVVSSALRPGRMVRADGVVLHLLPFTIRHMAGHPDVTFGLLRAAFLRLHLPADKVELKAEVNFGRVIGGSSLVPAEAVTPDDIVTFAYRHDHCYPSRVVVDVPKPATSYLTLMVRRDRLLGGNNWVLQTAYPGPALPSQPLNSRVLKGEPELWTRIMAFWCCHALVYDPSQYATPPFLSSWTRLCERRRRLGQDGFAKDGPYWTDEP